MLRFFSQKYLIGGLLPFIPAFVGIVLKFTFIDKYDANTNTISTFFVDTYLRSSWIDFIAMAYVSGFAAMASAPENRSSTNLWIYVGLPAVCFFLCIVLVMTTRKAGIENDFLQVYLPTIISGFSLATTGARNVR